MKMILLLLSSLLQTGYAASQNPNNVYIADVNCPLNCFEGSPCATGAPDFTPQFGAWTPTFPFLNDVENIRYHCECPPGRTGLLCEHEYETCDEEHFCFHGGKCLPALKDAGGNNKYYCDCKNAIHNGNRYAGRFCESRSVDFCSHQPDDDVFCVNGGTCKTNFQQSIEAPCHCPTGYEGPHCEYATGDVSSCTLQCHNGGACQIGTKEYGGQHDHYDDFWDEHYDKMYCVCPEGFFGLQCEIEGRQCGENHCFNGGACVTKHLSDGTVREFCDCSTAKTDEKSYAGRYCEAESTSFCSNMPDQNGHQFCANGGTCKPESHLGCDCLNGFHGPICEFRDTSAMAHSEWEAKCSLECKNNGLCRKGAKDLSFLKKFGMNFVPEDSYSDEFEHCVCPRGYVGLNCEQQVEVCPGGQHICMHGAQCLLNEGDAFHFHCDCDAIKSDLHKFTGDYCEMQSTELCTEDNRPGRGRSSNAFCVNNGSCVAHVGESEGHPGCICPFGFEGQHCEIVSESRSRQHPLEQEHPLEDEHSLKHESSDGHSRRRFKWIVLVIVLNIIANTVYFCGPRFRKRVFNNGSEHPLDESLHNSIGSAFSQRKVLPPLRTLSSIETIQEEDCEEYHDETHTHSDGDSSADDDEEEGQTAEL